MAERPSASSSLQRITNIANQLASGCPNARELVRELFVVFNELQQSYRGPKPIATAPRQPEHTLLLYCPEQGGWQTGEWIDKRECWVSTAAVDQCLEPTHWTDVPPDPQVSHRADEVIE